MKRIVEKFPITKKGYGKLEEEIKFLKHTKRPEVIKKIAEAREFGDLSENSEYHAAREEQSMVEGRILYLEDLLGQAEIINSSNFSGDTIKFGAKVMLLDNDTEEKIEYTIVGEYESKPADRLISIGSLLARTLIGKEVGDIIEFNTPNKTKKYEILSIDY